MDNFTISYLGPESLELKRLEVSELTQFNFGVDGFFA